MEKKEVFGVSCCGKVACPADGNGTPRWEDVEKMGPQELLRLVFSNMELAEIDAEED